MGLARSEEAIEITEQEAVPQTPSCEVAWLGPLPDWLGPTSASGALEGVALTSLVSSSTQVVHLAPQAPSTAAAVRATHPEVAIVTDLGGVDSVVETSAGAAASDVALVDSELDARRVRERFPGLDGRVQVAPAPIDLTYHAPEESLNRLPGAYIRRFRRLHRLAHPTVLFVGAYTKAGGLDLAIAAAYRLREKFEDVRLAAVPLGSTDEKYRDRCEMDALGLGHRGIIEWTVTDDDLRCWYATATVVCCPWREPVAAPVPPTFAAAAARPFVGSNLDSFRLSLRPPDSPDLVPIGDLDALVAALSPLLADTERATQLGRSARETVEAVCSYDAAATRLAGVWRSLAERSLTGAR